MAGAGSAPLSGRCVPSVSVTLSSGTAGTLDFAGSPWAAAGAGSGGFCTGLGAGMTPVMPSGPSLGFSAFLSRRSAAPPGRGLNAVAADAAFHSAPAISPLDFFALIMGPRPGLTGSSGSGGGFGGDASSAGGADCGVGGSGGEVGNVEVDVRPRRSGVLSLGEPTSLPVARLSLRRLKDSLRPVTLSLLRGGGTGSLRIPGLMRGAGTRSLSVCKVRNGSIGGLLLSGGLSSGCGIGDSGGRKGELPFMPFLVLGRRLLVPSSLLAVIDAATESWLWFLAPSLRREGSIGGRPESKL